MFKQNNASTITRLFLSSLWLWTSIFALHNSRKPRKCESITIKYKTRNVCCSGTKYFVIFVDNRLHIIQYLDEYIRAFYQDAVQYNQMLNRTNHRYVSFWKCLEITLKRSSHTPAALPHNILITFFSNYNMVSFQKFHVVVRAHEMAYSFFCSKFILVHNQLHPAVPILVSFSILH